MAHDIRPQIGPGAPQPAHRIGFAELTRLAFEGNDLRPLHENLLRQIAAGSAQAGEGLDLSLIAQLLGDQKTGLAIQDEVLGAHRLFRSPCPSTRPGLTVLALAAPVDIGSNTPIECLLEGSDIALLTLYVLSEADLAVLPEHDVAIVIASDSDGCAEALRVIDRHAAAWPRPLLNPPARITRLDRDKLWRLLEGVDGLLVPRTVSVARADLAAAALEPARLPRLASGFPIIVRPRGSHAGRGLARIADAPALLAYLQGRAESEFFISPFVDYAGEDGLYRKYRIVVVNRRPFACHMAIAGEWNIWYLNAGMGESESKRREEEAFMRSFDSDFAVRHARALDGMIERIGLDYFIVDCAETRDGRLLVFEADNTAVVHAMDPPAVYPYKPAQMRMIFEAFAAMLRRRARQDSPRAA